MHVSDRARILRTALALFLGLATLPASSHPLRAQGATGQASGGPTPESDRWGLLHRIQSRRSAPMATATSSMAAAADKELPADLHPMGGYAVMALGHVLPVPANTQWDPDVLELRHFAIPAKSYCGPVSQVARRGEQRKSNKAPYWNAVTNNCNHFIGELAQAVGLKVPGSFQVSYSFVPALKELNGGGSEGASKTSGERRAAAAPRT